MRRALVVLLVFVASAVTALAGAPTVDAAGPPPDQYYPGGGPHRSIALIGDSVTVGILPHIVGDLVNAGWGPVRTHADLGTRAEAGANGAITKIRAWRDIGYDPRAYVIALGANDVGITGTSVSLAQERIRNTVEAIGPGHEIMWVTITHFFGEWEAAWNEALALEDARYPNLHVYDWATEVKQHPDWRYGDLIHCTPVGYRNRSLLIAAAATSFMSAAQPVTGPARATAAEGPASGFTPLDPQRVVDTRQTGNPLALGETRVVDVSAYVPAGATAAAVNLTVDDPAGPGFLTAWACGARPFTSALNFATGRPRGAGAVVNLDAGRFCVYTIAATHLIVDVNGAYVPGGGARLTPTSPDRILDTRQSGGRLGQGGVVQVTVPPLAGAVPSAAVVNLTADGAANPGYLTAYPCGGSQPTASNVNYLAGDPTANVVQVKLGPGGTLCIVTLQPADVVVDLLGVYGDGGLWYQAATPARLLDTREGVGGWLGSSGSFQTINVDLATVTGLPASAQAIVGTTTATAGIGDGFVTTWPCANVQPTASTLNYTDRQNVPNGAVIAVGADRRMCLTSNQPAYFVFDLTGWFAP